ncbi:MAG: YraN family protein [Clostridia bacterium]|nr:YraN family protein [Clostridia bacterium]
MAVENKKLGAQGEKQACRYLEKSGYKILESNYKNPFGEVDIIAQKGDTVAFIEVKTRLSENYGAPSEAVNRKRRNKYIQAAKYYFYGKEIDVTVRFDIIEIFRGEINHIENAFF